MPTQGGLFMAWKQDGWRMLGLGTRRGKRRQARLQHPPTLPWPSDCPSSRDNLTGGRATEMPPSSAWPVDDAAAQQAGHEKKTWSTPRVFTVHGPCKSFFAPPRRRPHAVGHWPFRKRGRGPNAPQAHHGSMEARCWLISGTIATDRNMATHGPSPDLTAKSDQSPSRASL